MARMGHSMLPPQQQPHQVLPPDTAVSHAHPIQARNEEVFTFLMCALDVIRRRV